MYCNCKSHCRQNVRYYSDQLVVLYCSMKYSRVYYSWSIFVIYGSVKLRKDEISQLLGYQVPTTRQLTNVASDASNTTSKGLWIWYAIFRNCMSYQTKTLGIEVYVQTQYIISTEYWAEIEIRMNGVKQTFVTYIPRKIYSQKGCIYYLFCKKKSLHVQSTVEHIQR